jgi:hypothetical protein
MRLLSSSCLRHVLAVCSDASPAFGEMVAGVFPGTGSVRLELREAVNRRKESPRSAFLESACALSCAYDDAASRFDRHFEHTIRAFAEDAASQF